jgi:hypothetical protein
MNGWTIWFWMTVAGHGSWFPMPQHFDSQDDCIVAGIVAQHPPFECHPAAATGNGEGR